MKAEKPAEGILKMGEWGASKWYHVHCECGCDACSHEVEIEADDINVQVHIHHVQHTKWWERNRWSQIWQILTKGYAEMQTTIVMNEQTAVNYAAALKSAAADVKTLRAEMLAERKANKND